jgi:hypothetical protein
MSKVCVYSGLKSCIFSGLTICCVPKKQLSDHNYNANSKSKVIMMRLGGGDEEYYTHVTSSDLQVIRLYVGEVDNDANKNSTLI